MFNKERSERGAVTVFLIIIFAFVFAFVSVFIDYSRMSSLQAQSEQITHAAVRSVLSAYDPVLLEQYGLFAYGETDENYIMSKVMKDQASLLQRSDDLSILKSKVDSSTITLERPLGMYPVFSQQVREQMKYKAPINFTIEIMNKFKPMSKVMKEASNTVDLLGMLQKLYDERERKLDQLLHHQRTSSLAVKELFPWILHRGASSIQDQSLGGSISTAGDAAAQFNDYKAKSDEDSQRLPLERVYDAEIFRYEAGTTQVFNHITRGQQTDAQKHSSLLPEAVQLVEEARQINDQMKQVIQNSENRSADDGYNRVGSDAQDETAGSGEIRKIREQTHKLLLPDDLLNQLKENIVRQQADFDSFSSRVNELVSKESMLLSTTSGNSAPVKSAVIAASRAGDAYMLKYCDSGSLLDQEDKQLQSYRSYDAARKKAESESKSKLEEAGNILKQLAALKDKMDSNQQQFNTLESYYKAILQLNTKSSDSTENNHLKDSSPYSSGKQSMEQMDGLYGSMSSLLSGITDNCLQTEYAADYFKHFDVTRLKEAVKGNKGALDELGEQLSPQHQEIEYILYGFHNPGGNLAAAYGEIFSARLAVRTMEGFIKKSSAGNPLLILALALLYGIEHAIMDMVTLCEKGSIPLSDYFKVELSYRDYLRIFMLLHGQSDSRLSRMLAVIRLNTGINPADRKTYISSEVTMAMPLWFLPGVAKALNVAGASEGRVEGNRYYAVKKADFSY
ncbi:DUF5702 domain-containing protein [Paenibacillus sp. J22TS3]|uniref:DUF5702 domain-containing protein n=1 Tax=Paenibacillus sp. J22TS3 TaxID=2807192 RepID=UPI001B17120D|nr:DUF5702 domain-containing protein [Paenibacillus sp. J22TS3]GIP22590.1 hypothetical protein J22TS3_28650 [Paenibacillus sp. J22TS3]